MNYNYFDLIEQNLNDYEFYKNSYDFKTLGFLKSEFGHLINIAVTGGLNSDI